MPAHLHFSSGGGPAAVSPQPLFPSDRMPVEWPPGSPGSLPGLFLCPCVPVTLSRVSSMARTAVMSVSGSLREERPHAAMRIAGFRGIACRRKHLIFHSKLQFPVSLSRGDRRPDIPLDSGGMAEAEYLSPKAVLTDGTPIKARADTKKKGAINGGSMYMTSIPTVCPARNFMSRLTTHPTVRDTRNTEATSKSVPLVLPAILPSVYPFQRTHRNRAEAYREGLSGIG